MPISTLDALRKESSKSKKRDQASVPRHREVPKDEDFTPEKLSEGEDQTSRASAVKRRSSRPKPETVRLPLEELSPSTNKARVSSAMSSRSGKRGPGRTLEDAPASPNKSKSLLGLNRKAMEEERLARLARKEAPDTPEERPRKIAKIEATSATAKSGTPKESSFSWATHKPPASTPTLPTQAAASHVPYPHGVIKRTWALGHPRRNDIKIEEVLQRTELKTAVLSSWQMDIPWIASKLDLTKTKLILVMECKYDEDKAQWREECQQWSRSLRLCFPPMGRGPFERMHSKLMLLFYPLYLRVAVPSANLEGYDWGETGVMENTVFLIDLPRLPPEAHGQSDNETMQLPFARELLRFLDAQEMDEDLKQGLNSFDFSNTTHLAFVHSIHGFYHGEEAIKRTGYPLFASSIQELGLQTEDNMPLQIDVVTSSMASLTADRVQMLYDAFRGRHNCSASTKAPKSKGPGTDNSNDSLKDSFRVFFPSIDTIKESKGGQSSAGTIFMPNGTWDKPGFPRHLFRDSVSTRKGLLSHNKIILGRTPHSAFIYTGSANLSQSAWGNLTWDRKAPGGADWKLNVSNWECGVLMRVKGSPAAESGGTEVLSMDEAFRGVLEMPFEWPGRKFEDNGDEGKALLPWMQVAGGF